LESLKKENASPKKRLLDVEVEDEAKNERYDDKAYLLELKQQY